LKEDCFERVGDEAFDNETTKGTKTKLTSQYYGIDNEEKKSYPPLGQATQKSRSAQPHVFGSIMAS
jgi:hypothetical protein